MAVSPTLSYCNRCGAELKPKRNSEMKLSEASTDSLVWAIATVTIVGLGVVIGMMAVMKRVLYFSDALIVGFTLLTFLSFLGVDIVFIWVLLRSKMAAGKSEIEERNMRALSAPAMGVTEHTTRTLETADKQSKLE
jgi:hypothetical protein